jgi:hypothetical protein
MLGRGTGVNFSVHGNAFPLGDFLILVEYKVNSRRIHDKGKKWPIIGFYRDISDINILLFK